MTLFLSRQGWYMKDSAENSCSDVFHTILLTEETIQWTCILQMKTKTGSSASLYFTFFHVSLRSFFTKDISDGHLQITKQHLWAKWNLLLCPPVTFSTYTVHYLFYKKFLRKEGKYFGLMPFNIIFKFSWCGNLLAVLLYTLIEDTSIS